MYLSDQTIAILRAFSSVNQGIVLQKGSTISVVNAAGGNIFASAVVPECFGKVFAIESVPTFLNILKTMKKPKIINLGMGEQQDKKLSDVQIAIIDEGRDGKTKATYTSADPRCISHVKGTEIAMNPDIMGMLEADDLIAIQKASAPMGLNAVRVVQQGEDVFLEAFSSENNTPDTYRILVQNAWVREGTDMSIPRILTFDNFKGKLLQGKHELHINENVMCFRYAELDDLGNCNIRYWFGMEEVYE